MAATRTMSLTRPSDPDVGSNPWQFSVGLVMAAMGVMLLMVLFIVSAVVAGWVSDQDPAKFGRIGAYQSWLLPVAMAAVATVMVGIAIILWGIVRRLWVRVEGLKESLPSLIERGGATDVQPLRTNIGPVTVTATGTGQSMIHTIANWMWVPMIMMGVMAIATSIGLGVAQASVGSDLGEEFTALRQANFETLKPLTGAFVFLGIALLLSGISFLLATILGALRWGGGEVQESVGGQVKTLKMPLSAMIFLGLMMMGLMAQFVAFGTLIYVAAQVHDAWASATAAGVPADIAAFDRANAYAVWVNPLRLVSVGVLLTGIVFALYTISNVLRFQFSRIRELITGAEEGGA